MIHSADKKVRKESSVALNHHELTHSEKKTVRKETSMSQDDNTEAEVGVKQWFICNVCQTIFPTESLWRNHSVSCSEKKPFVCEVCHMGFVGENQLIRHKEECHGTGDC